MAIRVLIKSAGDKRNLIQEFSRYANVVVEDKNPLAKCFLYADAWIGEYCDLVIETRDAVIQHPLLYDKIQFSQFCKRHGFDKPSTFVIDKKMILKPRNGAGSKGLIILDRGYLMQEFVDWPEYSVDYIADREGKTVSVIPRKRLNIVNGEAKAAQIDFDPYLIKEATRMGQELGIKGAATMQLFYDKVHIKWIEVNPRFGGGSHFTWHLFSGPKFLVNECEEAKMRDSNVSKGNQMR